MWIAWDISDDAMRSRVNECWLECGSAK